MLRTWHFHSLKSPLLRSGACNVALWIAASIGQMELQGAFEDGLKHGIWRGWYENGQQEYEEFLKLYGLSNG